jgi:CheY-like chemotaxis protein
MSRPLAGLRLLVAEDDADNAEMLATTLAYFGADVRTVASAREALEAASEWLPDVILLDLWMPLMDGCALAQELRKKPAMASTRILAVTAHSTVPDKRRTVAAGFDAHVSKPVDGDALVDLIARLVAANESSEDSGGRESLIVERVKVRSRSVG